jgi:uncharacterized membrane protein
MLKDPIFIDDIASVTQLDIMALLWFLCAVIGYDYFANRRYNNTHNLMQTVDRLRVCWMQNMLKRYNRISDATLLGNLLRSIAFFASTTILILVGLISVLGAKKEGMMFVEAIPFSEPSSLFMWEFKIIFLILIFVYTFFKMTWSLRQYNYACILVGAAPSPDMIGDHEAYGNHIGRLVCNAGRHFNLGLRGYYFGMAAVSWFVDSAVFIGVTTLVILVLYRREFRSHTVNNLRELEMQ